MLASMANASSQSTSRAHSERSPIDHSGARNIVTSPAPAVRSAPPAPKQVGAELAGSQLVHAPMVIAVGSELVSRRRDLLDELGMPLGQPADDEERGANAGAIEQIEQPPRRELHPRRQPVPVRERKRVDAADVEPFLHVNGEDVGHRRGRPGVRIGLGLAITSISRAAAR